MQTISVAVARPGEGFQVLAFRDEREVLFENAGNGCEMGTCIDC
jgi:hypothetical protein